MEQTRAQEVGRGDAVRKEGGWEGGKGEGYHLLTFLPRSCHAPDFAFLLLFPLAFTSHPFFPSIHFPKAFVLLVSLSLFSCPALPSPCA